MRVDPGGVLPTQLRTGAGTGRLAEADRGCLRIGQQEVAQVEMDVPVRTRMLIEVDDDRTRGGVPDHDRRLLTSLPECCDIWPFIALDVSARL